MKYKPQHSRLLFIDRKIGEGGFPNCNSLAAEWEVSAKTIQRDLEYMRDMLAAPIVYVAARRGYKYSEANFTLPAMSVSESDLFAIYLAEEILSQYRGTPIYDSLAQIFKKIEASLPHKINPVTNQDQPLFSFLRPPTTTIDTTIWHTVFASLRHGRQLSISYQSSGTTAPRLRLIDPYHAIRFEGDWYIIAFCHLRQQIRTFSLARITKATEQKDTFTPPPNFNFHQLSKSRFGLHWGGEETTVVINFQPTVAPYIQERRWHPSQQLATQPDGSLTLTLTVTHLLELKRWLLSWGSQAKVVSPASLARQIRQEAEALLTIYNCP